MSAIEFIARIAWPAVILIVALIYRRPLADLIAGGVTRFRAGPFELAWDQAKSGVERSRASSSASPSSSTPSPIRPSVGLLGGELSALAESNPRETVLRTYETVRQAIRRGLEEVGVELDDDADSLDALGLVRIAETRNIVPPEVTDAVLGLNVLYNLAEHAPEREMSPSRAYEYLAMADAALYAFATAAARHSGSRLKAV